MKIEIEVPDRPRNRPQYPQSSYGRARAAADDLDDQLVDMRAALHVLSEQIQKKVEVLELVVRIADAEEGAA